MAVAEELPIDTSASALDMANAIFGEGVTVVSATYTGDPLSSGIYTDGTSVMDGIITADTGVILSTGTATDITNSDGSTDTNQNIGTSTDTTGVDGDAGLNSLAGTNTYDAAILDVVIIPDGDILTMQFVFTSEEYPEWINQGFNDVFGVWVNGDFVPFTITTDGQVSIDTVNPTANSNLYVDNTGDQANTEMDGTTYVLSIKAPVTPGVENTIRIGVADAGDSALDSNLLIMGDSGQTVALAMDDQVNSVVGEARTFDLLSNDLDTAEGGLTITMINGQPIAVGETLVLDSGATVTLNADGTITMVGAPAPGLENISYTVVDVNGVTDVGFVMINTVAADTLDGIVSGTTSGDLIDASYTSDPDGDLVDAGDATGLMGTTGDDDVIYGGEGADTILAGAGDDIVEGDEGSDEIYGGAGADSLWGEDGTDSLRGDDGADALYGGAANDNLQGDVGADTLSGGSGADSLYGGDDADSLSGGTGADSLEGGSGADTLAGGDDADRIVAGSGDDVQGGSGGTDQDTLVASGVVQVTFDPADSESGTLTFADGSTATFTDIEVLELNGGSPDGVIWAGSGADSIGAGFVDSNGDIVDAGDAIYAGAGPDDDDIFGNDGNDTIDAGQGDDNIYGGNDQDLIEGNAGDDYAQGDAGQDTLYGGDGADFLRGDAGDDSVFGGVGDDTVYGGADNDVVDAGEGNDSLFGGFGNDSVYGGDGDDTLTGSDGDDTVYGGAGADSMQGSTGADIFYGGDGADTMWGEEDADVFYAGGGDVVDGYETGTDDDTLVVSDVASINYSTTDQENGTVTFTDGSTLTFANIEHIVIQQEVNGTSGADSMAPGYVDAQGDIIDGLDGLDDTIRGDAGADTIAAGDGADTVYGGDDGDQIDGGAGDDLILGEAGADILIGGAGIDSLYGGDDADTIFGGMDDLVDGGETGDDNDTLDLSAYGHSGTNITYNIDSTEDGTVEFLDADGAIIGTMTFSGIENVIACFTPGTRIVTIDGTVVVEDLRAGDRVLTRDNGYQTLRWTGRRDLTPAELLAEPRFAPVRIAKGALGHGLPEGDLTVSPQHRILISGPEVELLFGEFEVLVAALHLVGRPGITRVQPLRVSYLHLLFDSHEIVSSEGLWTESFQPGANTLAGLAAEQRAEVLGLFPELAAGVGFGPARLSLKRHEVRTLARV